MPFPPITANSYFHHEQYVRYVAQGGNWRRGGVKDEPVHTNSFTMVNKNDTVYCGGERQAENKIIIDLAFMPSADTDLLLYFWNWSLGDMGLNKRIWDTTRVVGFYGPSNFSNRNWQGTQPVELSGIVFNDFKDTNRRCIADRLHNAHIEIHKISAGKSRISCNLKSIMKDGGLLDTQSIFEGDLPIKDICFLGITFRGDPIIKRMNLLSQWW